MNKQFKIRPARKEDAPHIARGIVMALHDEIAIGFAGSRERLPLVYRLFTELAACENAQYSYLNTLVAEDDEGSVAGIIVAYDGSRLHELREAFVDKTNAILGSNFNNDKMDNETSDDEVYVDSLAVFPEYRGHNLGSQLIEAMAKRHANSGKPLGLLCEQGYDHLFRLYTSLGFKDAGMRPFAGTMMHHLQR